MKTVHNVTIYDAIDGGYLPEFMAKVHENLMAERKAQVVITDDHRINKKIKTINS